MAVVWWIVALVACLIVEAATMSLVSIWFAAGAVGGLLCAACDLSVAIQLMVFAVITAVTLIFTRPALKRLLPVKAVPTNADLDIGRTATVIKRIDSSASDGRVRLDGVDWSAVSEDGSSIEEGETVVVTARGATVLTVRRKEDTR